MDRELAQTDKRFRKAGANRRFIDPRRQLAWLLELANLEHLSPQRLRRREVAGLQSRARQLCAALGGSERLCDFVGGLSEVQIGRFCKPVHDNLEKLYAGESWTVESGERERRRGDENVEGLTRTSRVNRRTGRVESEYGGDDPTDEFLWLCDDFVIGYHDLIRRCSRRACGRFFVKQKRQLYCSEKCAGHERQHRFLGRLTAEQRERRWRESYADELERQEKFDAARHYRLAHGLSRGKR
jgi:hypothetical protein